MVLAQAGLGLRIGELLALRVQDVDFLRRTVRIEWQFTQGSKGERSEPKTPRSKRRIPLPRVVAEALASIWRRPQRPRTERCSPPARGLRWGTSTTATT
ncbi:tyrosine-type recombinase/integrase [Geodermatophilus sp. URMC 65]